MQSRGVEQALASLTDMGWISDPSPLESLDALGTQLGIEKLWVKHDDLLPSLGGGSKVRKLDLLVAQPLYQERRRWHTTGARGSGHLVACAKAASLLGHQLVAHCFPQPASEQVEANFAITREYATKVEHYPSRLALTARRPYLMALDRWRTDAIIAPGGSSAAGCAAFVRAAFELRDQCLALGIAMPDRIYLPIGSGGAAVGLALGLALAGAATQVYAIATVERALLLPPRIFMLKRSLLSWLTTQGVPVPSSRLRLRLHIDFSQIGAGYAHPSAASRDAVDLLRRYGLGLESVYSGKAMAALQRDAHTLSSKNILFWLTCHGTLS